MILRTTKKYYKKLLNYNKMFYIYRVLYVFLSKSERVSRKYFNSAYQFYFSKGRLIKAYSFKVEQFIKYELGNDETLKEGAKNYLDIVNDQDFIDLLEVNENRKKYLKSRLINNEIIVNKEGGDLNVLLIGPAFSSLSNINFDKYDYVVFNKPLINDNLGVPPEKIIIFLNNQWSIGNFKDKTISWIRNNKFAKIITPNELLANRNDVIKFTTSRNYLSASPMGLQRVLYFLLLELNPKNIEVIGYDFQLSKNPYNSWYPSGVAFCYEAWMHTNMKHDFLFNFLFTKKIKQQFGGRINGAIDPYLEMNAKQIITLFEKRIEELRS
jgi:hypothetical protein